MRVTFFSAAAFLALILCASCSPYVAPSSGPVDMQDSFAGMRELSMLVYMAADNDLAPSALEDLNEMEAAFYDRSSFAVLALADMGYRLPSGAGTKSGAAMYEIAHDAGGMNGTVVSPAVDCPELGLHPRGGQIDMAREETLSAALSFMRRSYPARRYALVIWGHGTGWRGALGTESGVRAFAIDDGSGTCLPLSGLRAAIERGMEGEALELIGFDTCFGAELEVCYELKDCGRWLCGAGGVEPLSGWDYERWLSGMEASCADGKGLSDLLYAQLERRGKSTFCALRLSWAGAVFGTFDSLARSLADYASGSHGRKTVLSLAEGAGLMFAPGTESDAYMPVYGFCEAVSREIPGLSDAAHDVMEAVSLCVEPSYASADALNALGVYVCDVDASGCMTRPSGGYARRSGESGQCRFIRDSQGYVPGEGGSGALLSVLFGD